MRVFKNHDSLDFTVEEFADGEFQVWTPDLQGACIGFGRSKGEAIDSAILNLKSTLRDLRNAKRKGGAQ